MTKYHQLKIKDKNRRNICKPKISSKEAKRRLIIVAQRYKNQVKQSGSLEELTLYTNRFLSYVINKKITSNFTFIRSELEKIFDLVIYAYKYDIDLSPMLSKDAYNWFNNLNNKQKSIVKKNIRSRYPTLYL